MLFFAAEHFDRNAATVERKRRIAIGMAALFLVEMVLMVIWISSPPTNGPASLSADPYHLGAVRRHE
jgi:hypothetical protein